MAGRMAGIESEKESREEKAAANTAAFFDHQIGWVR